MLKIEKFVTASPEQWEIIIEGMRNPKNSWDRMDSLFFDDAEGHLCERNQCVGEATFIDIGPNDHKLMDALNEGGPVHAKYRRMIAVYLDVTAPLYWWKEFDTYKVGTVRNSCSTMHKIHVKPFTIDDFSHDAIDEIDIARVTFEGVINTLEYLRVSFNETQNNKYWRALIQLLPDGFNMKATLMLNYEVLVGIYRDRKNHKLDEWHVFCDWISELPYSEIIIGERD